MYPHGWGRFLIILLVLCLGLLGEIVDLCRDGIHVCGCVKKNLGRLLWTYVRDGRIAQGWTYSVSTSEGACLFDPLGRLPWTGWARAYLILFHKRGYRRCKSTSVQRRSRSQKSEGFD